MISILPSMFCQFLVFCDEGSKWVGKRMGEWVQDRVYEGTEISHS